MLWTPVLYWPVPVMMGTEFDLYGSLEPCFLVACLRQGTAELLEPDVLARLQPLIEEALADDGEECP